MQVVVIHKPSIYLASRRGRHRRRVLRIELRIVRHHSLQPCPSPRFTPRLTHRSHHNLERSVSRRKAYPATPPRIRETLDRRRKVRWREGIGVVHDDPRAPRYPNPLAIRITCPLRRGINYRTRQVGEQRLDDTKTTRVLREEYIRRRVIPLLQQSTSHLTRATVTNLNRNSRQSRKLLQDRIDQRGTTTRIDGKRGTRRRLTRRRGTSHRHYHRNQHKSDQHSAASDRRQTAVV